MAVLPWVTLMVACGESAHALTASQKDIHAAHWMHAQGFPQFMNFLQAMPAQQQGAPAQQAAPAPAAAPATAVSDVMAKWRPWSGIVHTDMMAWYYYMAFGAGVQKVMKANGGRFPGFEQSGSKAAAPEPEEEEPKAAPKRKREKDNVASDLERSAHLHMLQEATAAENAVKARLATSDDDNDEPTEAESFLAVSTSTGKEINLDIVSKWFDLMANFHISAACMEDLYWQYKDIAAFTKQLGTDGTAAHMKLTRAYQAVRQDYAFLFWQWALITADWLGIAVAAGKGKGIEKMAAAFGSVANRFADWCFGEWMISIMMDFYDLYKNPPTNPQLPGAQQAGSAVFPTTSMGWLKLNELTGAWSFTLHVKSIVYITYSIEMGGDRKLAQWIPFLGFGVANSAFYMDWFKKLQLWSKMKPAQGQTIQSDLQRAQVATANVQYIQPQQAQQLPPQQPQQLPPQQPQQLPPQQLPAVQPVVAQAAAQPQQQPVQAPQPQPVAQAAPPQPQPVQAVQPQQLIQQPATQQYVQVAAPVQPAQMAGNIRSL